MGSGDADMVVESVVKHTRKLCTRGAFLGTCLVATPRADLSSFTARASFSWSSLKTCRSESVYLYFMDNPSVIANLKGETNESEITSTIAN